MHGGRYARLKLGVPNAAEDERGLDPIGLRRPSGSQLAAQGCALPGEPLLNLARGYPKVSRWVGRRISRIAVFKRAMVHDMDGPMEEIEIPEVGVDRAADEVHEVHQDAQGPLRQTPWLRRLALTTAILAVLAAVASLQSGRFSNEAILEQARATDAWSYYQAKGNKLVTRTAEMEILLQLKAPADQVALLRAEVARYGDEQAEIQRRAADHEADSRGHLARHEWYAATVTLLQVAIGLSAIAALMESRRMWIMACCLGGCGAVLFIWRLFV